jgi:hypothetical protein
MTAKHEGTAAKFFATSYECLSIVENLPFKRLMENVHMQGFRNPEE